MKNLIVVSWFIGLSVVVFGQNSQNSAESAREKIKQEENGRRNEAKNEIRIQSSSRTLDELAAKEKVLKAKL